MKRIKHWDATTQFLILVVYLQLYWWKTGERTFKINVNSVVKPWLKIDEIAKRITSDQYTSSERVDTSEWKKVIWKKLVCTQLPLTLASFCHACDKDKIFYKISSYRSAVVCTHGIYFITFIKWYNIYIIALFLSRPKYVMYTKNVCDIIYCIVLKSTQYWILAKMSNLF